MNFPAIDTVIGRQRCRQWTPLITQQLRLRHLYRISAYNLKTEVQGGFYYTLHLTAMSAPFYTSDIVEGLNPKWAEVDIKSLPHLSTTTFVLRIWQQRLNELDVIIVTWAINLSGLVHLGNKRSDIQPTSFIENSVIFHMRGGYFTSHNVLKTDLQKPLPFIDSLNVISNEDTTKIYRNTTISIPISEIKKSYNLERLQRIHSLQVSIKNKSFNLQILRDKINNKCDLCANGIADLSPVQASTSTNQPQSNIRYAPQLLTMNSLNKMLQEKPTKLQRQEIVKITKEIEVEKFKIKLLMHEKDKKTALIRQFKQKHADLCDDNEERNSQLMENYHKLNKDMEKLREWKKSLIKHREIHLNTSVQLQHRRRQLMQQLLFIYPIQQINEQKFIINGIYLPNSDMLSDCSDSGLSVALGYATHILSMCSSFLQVPLRYPLTHMGSRSFITDQISSSLVNRDRDFPLYTKGKDRMQFDYAVYLLNKNLAQLRWLCGLHTPILKATLPNLLSLLRGKEQKNNITPLNNSRLETSYGNSSLTTNNGTETNSLLSLQNYGSFSNISDPVLDLLRQECQMERSISPPSRAPSKKITKTKSEVGLGLSEILAIPEAFLNRQISPNSFKNYMSTRYNSDNIGESSGSVNKPEKNCDNNYKKTIDNTENIEQGTDMLDPTLNINDIESKMIEVKSDGNLRRQSNLKKIDKSVKQKRRISRSVGSYTDEDCNNVDLDTKFEMGSDPLINISSETNKNVQDSSANLPSSLEDGQQEFLQKWLDSGPALLCSEENLYPDEVLGSTSTTSDNPLTARTDALLQTTSFNLVKPKL